ncbi:hypothetical protein HNQ80_000394 [Anaerosolibacter carboniphilus]|uniref:DUF2953 domain-containing protein n=1 Tax=Anaerosolibacter carboniphilus TaxID=1417629 RepID=A0A841KVX0_9FIRM|nr:hypothetical protein [Anaerosolibacter carboniphilus]MBB6214325.1 hypothetical protein [Anaerosolibacter carboniphilus]
MVLLYILIIAFLLLVVLLFTVASKIIIHFNSASSDLNVTLLWLYPVLKSVVSSENDSFILSIYLFNKRILKRQLTISKINMQNRNFFSKINPTDIHISTQYGFKDPYFTGLIFGGINIISRFFALESLYQRPSFLANDDFINIDATAKLNLGRSLLKLV